MGGGVRLCGMDPTFLKWGPDCLPCFANLDPHKHGVLVRVSRSNRL